ncbi:MAG: SMI1/KNR4 family protein [Clostridia bacterium]|nr:SMI1/KNR4 family protein [Clostridia bacterium]
MEEILNKIEKFSKLNPPAIEAELTELEEYLQVKLAKEVKELYLLHNGGEILGFEFLTIKKLIDEMKHAADLEENDGLSETDVATPRIRPKRWMKNRLHILGDYSGNYIAVDYNPTEEGIKGQIINCGRDEDKLYVFADNIKEFFEGILKLAEENKIDNETHLIDYFVNNNISFIKTSEDISDATSLKNLPKSEITFDLAYNVISDKPEEIAYVPQNVLNKELCILAVKKNPFSLKYFCNEIMFLPYRHEVYKAAVNSDEEIIIKRKGKASAKELELGDPDYVSVFNYIFLYNYSSENISELYYDAIKKDINILYKGFIKKIYIDDKCYEYIMSKMDFIEAIKYIPKQYKPKDKCLEVVRKDGLLIKYVPLDHRDKEMLMTAIEQNPEAIQLLPPNIQLQNEDVCIKAVELDGMLLQYIYPLMRNEKICKVAYKSNPNCIQFVPDVIQEKIL